MLTLKTMPVSTNRLYRGRRFLTNEGRGNKEAMAWEAKAAWRKPPLQGPVAVSVALYWPNARNHDLDNIKGLLDAFTGVLYEDDSQIVELHISKHIDRENPRVELELDSVV